MPCRWADVDQHDLCEQVQPHSLPPAKYDPGPANAGHRGRATATPDGWDPRLSGFQLAEVKLIIHFKITMQSKGVLYFWIRF